MGLCHTVLTGLREGRKASSLQAEPQAELSCLTEGKRASEHTKHLREALRCKVIQLCTEDGRRRQIPQPSDACATTRGAELQKYEFITTKRKRRISEHEVRQMESDVSLCESFEETIMIL